MGLEQIGKAVERVRGSHEIDTALNLLSDAAGKVTPKMLSDLLSVEPNKV